VWLFGTPRKKGTLTELIHPDFSGEDDGLERAGFGSLLPVYPAGRGFSPAALRRHITAMIRPLLPDLEEILPVEVLRRHRFPGRRESLEHLHFPSPDAPLDDLNGWRTDWHRRLIFEELFLFQLGLLSRRARVRRTPKSIAFKDRPELVLKMKAALPYALTPAQERAYREIADDMTSHRSMQRLLQGDVGSGKTVVAAMACLLAVANGAQAAVQPPVAIGRLGSADQADQDPTKRRPSSIPARSMASRSWQALTPLPQ
jgi:ATP-dependent DNA helicase RecG